MDSWAQRTACLLVALMPGAADAHDTRAVANPRFPPETRISSRELQALIDAQPAGSDARYIFQMSIRWTPGRTLVGCFLNGSDSQRGMVESSKDEMLKGTGVKIGIEFRSGDAFRDCQADAAGFYAEDVRVQFGGEDGCSAELGTVAKSRRAYSNGYVVAKNPSVFLGSGCEQVSTVKHELLHALGFHHEHQKPGNTCHFRYDVIAQRYNWSETLVKQNFDAMRPSNAFVSSRGFDDESIMRYSFDQSLLETQDCVGRQGNDLSDQDWLGLRAAYPATIDLAEHRRRIATKSAVAQGLGAQPSLQEAVQHLGEY